MPRSRLCAPLVAVRGVLAPDCALKACPEGSQSPTRGYASSPRDPSMQVIPTLGYLDPQGMVGFG